jgi:DNA-binding beta-propeller fold protein YncE
VNGDGQPDLIGGNFNDPTLKVFTHDGSGGFTLSTTVTVGSNPGSFVAADLNGDGRAELIGAGETANHLTVFTRGEDGTFTVSDRLAVGNAPESFKVADANGDGRPDLIIPDPSAGSLTIWTNDGNGAFGLASSTAMEWNAASWTAADLNGDGRADIVKANASGGGLTVLTNAGGGSFTSSTTVYPDAQPGSAILAADVTGDRKPDLVFVNSGANSLTVLRSVAPSPATTPHVYDFSIGAAAVPPLQAPGGVALDRNDNLFVADTGNHRIVKFTSQGQMLAAWGKPGAAAGEFSNPGALAIDSEGHVYVADSGNNRVQKFASDGTYLTQWTSPGITSVAVDGADHVYVADSAIQGQRMDPWGWPYDVQLPGVREFDGDGTVLRETPLDTAPFAYFANQGGAGGYSSAGLTVDGRGNLFVGYSYFYKDPWSGWAGSWSGSGIEKFSNEGTYLKSRPDYLSNAMAVDATDQVYAALASNRIKKYSNDGVALTQWGEPGSGPGQLSGPRGVAVDRTGNFVYVADSGNNRIQVFAQRPTLRIQRTVGSVIVTWSAAATGFTLQQKADLGTANWVNTTQAVATVDGENRVEIPASARFQAFRLVRP